MYGGMEVTNMTEKRMKLEASRQARALGHELAKDGIITRSGRWTDHGGEYSSECALCHAEALVIPGEGIGGQALVMDCDTFKRLASHLTKEQEVTNMTGRYRIETRYDSASYEDCGEGPWDTREEAITFARSEVGAPHRIVYDGCEYLYPHRHDKACSGPGSNCQTEYE